MTDRDANGRFVKGNPGGPGRPAKEREEKYYNLAMNTVTYKDWQAIINRAVKDAQKGDSSARKWLSDYLAPQTQRHELTGEINANIMVNWDDELPD